ncbi:helix-turn-helix domain-containing protein [Aquincola sp. MAHUQ-54]|uniref:Helix-turn-helix domain-containing protein n=1 Tax=Aquincola agrisoli TaxID=3119538 RepID=A0AAW9QGJ5_9BURK
MNVGQVVEDAPPAKLAEIRFCTEGLSDEDRFDAWRQRVDGLYGVSPSSEGGTPAFCMDTSSWQLGQIIAGTAAFGPCEQERTAQRIRADGVDHYRLTLVTHGALRVESDGRRTEIGQGHILFTDMSRPERRSISAGSNVSVFIAREVLDEALPRPLDVHGFVPAGALAMLLRSHLQSLAQLLPSLSVAEAASLWQPTVQMIAACIAPDAARLAEARGAAEVTLLRQVCRYIEMHLKDADLSPQDIASALKLSRATLYRLFEPLGGVAAYVKERRLNHIHELLCNADGRIHLGRISDTYGFKSAAHFSTAFRKHFGFSPSDSKAHGALAWGPAGASTRDLGSFGRWLRALR